MTIQNFPSTCNHQPIRVLIADDLAYIREELSALLQLTDQVTVVGTAVNGAEAITQAEALRPDVIVMDLEMPEVDGIAATREIKTRGWANRIIMLSVHADIDTVQRARDAGADIFVDKAAHFEKLLSAIVAKYQS
jgi:DNA-binding NarL/FixJ family response regulator